MGPICHNIAMKQFTSATKKLSVVPVFWTPGNLVDGIEADFNLQSHGYDVPNNRGSLVSVFGGVFSQLVSNIKQQDISNGTINVRRMIHLILDSLAIGQISGPLLWGSKDNFIDFACELATNKTSKVITPTSYEDYEALEYDLVQTMTVTYLGYINDVAQWFKNSIVSPREVSHMTARAIRLSSAIGIGAIELAYNLGGSPAIAKSKWWHK